MQYRDIPKNICFVLDRLRAHGYDAYVVGGCVRDMLLGRVPNDFDVCTDALPDQTIACFDDKPVIKTGMQHGTVSVIVNREAVEVTTYRIDGDYSDHRRPDQVEFTSDLHADLARRDFTINAMAYRPDTGVIDPYGGKQDLDRGIIRCVGVPAERFAEDALRLARALRFASRYGFSIEPETAHAMLLARDTLAHVAVERMLSELCGMDFAKISPEFLPVLQAMVPELTSLSVPDHLPNDPALRLAALLRGLDADAILSRLRASTAVRSRVALLVSEMETPIGTDDVSIRRALNRMHPEALSQLLLYWQDVAAQAAMERILARGDCYTLSMLAVNGNDLLSLGISGRDIGKTLAKLLDAVIAGDVPNDRDTLLSSLS